MKRRIPTLWTVTALVVVLTIAAPWSAYALVWTDKPDYSPGETVAIFGDNSNQAGYIPGETVHVDVEGPNGYEATCEGVADAAGAWSCQVTLWEGSLAVGEYTYTATGLLSSVVEVGMFTDGNVTVYPAPADLSFTLHWQIYKSLNCTGGTQGNPGSGTVTSTGLMVSVPNAKSILLTADDPTGYAFDQWTGLVTSTSNPVCINDPGGGVNALHANFVSACTPPQVTDDPADIEVTYGEDASFQVAGTDYTSVQWQVSADGGEDWDDIADATFSTLDVIAPTVSMSGYLYRAVLTGDCEPDATSAAATLTVNKADPTCTISGWTGTYDGDPHGASGTCTGVDDEELAGLALGEAFTDVPGGTAYWTFTDVTGNYNDDSGSVAIVISQADAVCVVNGWTGTYDGDPHGASGTCTGVKGEDLSAGLSYDATFTDVPGGTVNWTFEGGTNYKDQGGTAQIVISKADPTCTVTGYDVIYDGLPHTATGTCTGVKDETLSGLNLAGTTHTVGDYPNDPWAFTDVTGNYNNRSGTVHDRISYSTGTCYGGPGHTILQPINSDGSSLFKQKSTVPAKFRVCDANGNSVGTPGVVTSFVLYAVSGGASGTDEPVDSTTPDTEFRWSADGQQWIFNMSTKNLAARKTYYYRITLNDGTKIEFSFALK